MDNNLMDKFYCTLMYCMMIGLFFLGCVIARLPYEQEKIVTVVIDEREPCIEETPYVEEALSSNLPLEIPMPESCQAALEEVCESEGIPITVALGLIETESTFKEDAVSYTGCYGLCQLNPRYFPCNLTAEDNIREGIKYLGYQLRRYGNWESALTAYNAGHDTGSREYSTTVLKNAEKWGFEP